MTQLADFTGWLESLLTEACARAGQDCVTWTRTQEPDGYLTFTLRGDRGGRAECSLSVSEACDVVWMSVGHDARVEMAVDDGWRDPRFDSFQDQLVRVVGAVVAGKVSEQVWLSPSGQTLRSVGVFALDEGPYEVSARSALRVPRDARRRDLHYGPYCDG